ncbi:MAG TPA: hypothetical protein VMY77_04720, partial [Chitinophagaceae bacterium]|nr:hypothetical protein [Chitinophagaceae bacterium]
MIKTQWNCASYLFLFRKKHNFQWSLTILCLLVSVAKSFGQMGVSNTSITPNASSILELRSTTAGFLPPRMTTAERDAIASPATGLVIYNTTTNLLNFYNGSSWQITGSTGEPAIVPVNTANKYWNGYKNFVTLNSDSLTEGLTNIFYTSARSNLKL